VTALAIGLAGLVLTGLGLLVDPRQAWMSYLAALATGLSLTLGALMLVAVTHLTGARWFDPLRLLALDIAGTLPLFAGLFLLLLPGLGTIYPWMHAPSLPNRAYLNVPFFAARAAVYFGIWTTVGALLRRWALERSPDAALPPGARERALSAAALPALGLSLTFAAFDWLMSLAPRWFSTIYGVYWFAGGFLAALALVALLAFLAVRAAPDRGRIATRQWYALGALMLTFVVFWAYIAYCQYLIIWIGDVPAEVAWYLPRVRGSWGALALVLLFGQFVTPLLVLLFHAAKTNSRVLAAVSGWLLVMHYLDVYWLVLPELHPDALHPHWLDLTALGAVGGTATAYGAWLRRR
jgi:hypothetical protein